MSTKKGANPAPEFKWYIADKPVNGNINNTKEEVEDGKINFISIFEYIGGAIKEFWDYIFEAILLYRVSEGKLFFFNLTLRERNIQVGLYLKVVLKS